MRSTTRFATVLLALLAAACGKDKSITGPSAGTAAGNYEMVQSNRPEVVRGYAALRINGTYVEQFTLATGYETETGTYTVDGTALTFTPSAGASYTGTVTSDGIDITHGSVEAKYRRY